MNKGPLLVLLALFLGVPQEPLVAKVIDGNPLEVQLSEGAVFCSGCNPLVFGRKVNVNTAPMEHLLLLPGIGPTKAQRLLDWRKAHGSFSQLEDVLQVQGIGPKTLRKLQPYCTTQ